MANIPVKVSVLQQINIVKFGDCNRHEAAGIPIAAGIPQSNLRPELLGLIWQMLFPSSHAKMTYSMTLFPII